MILWSRVGELRDEVGADDFNEVVDLFLEEVDEVILRLQGNYDRSLLEQDLHFLKGSALSLGFQAFSDICQHGERRAAAGGGAQVDIGAVIEVFNLSRAIFMAGLPEHLAA
jgi:HPt (histidine-containing phosphotransfer) domain-containing protein